MRGLIMLPVLALAVPALAAAYPGHEYEHDANVTLQQARKLAKRAWPGRIVSQELEREHGASGMRYSFDLRRGGKTREVGVDARTGRILENAPETADHD